MSLVTVDVFHYWRSGEDEMENVISIRGTVIKNVLEGVHDVEITDIYDGLEKITTDELKQRYPVDIPAYWVGFFEIAERKMLEEVLG